MREKQLKFELQIKGTRISYDLMHPWEGHNPLKHGMLTVVPYCFFVDFFFFANKHILQDNLFPCAVDYRCLFSQAIPIMFFKKKKAIQ